MDVLTLASQATAKRSPVVTFTELVAPVHDERDDATYAIAARDTDGVRVVLVTAGWRPSITDAANRRARAASIVRDIAPRLRDDAPDAIKPTSPEHAATLAGRLAEAQSDLDTLPRVRADRCDAVARCLAIHQARADVPEQEQEQESEQEQE